MMYQAFSASGLNLERKVVILSVLLNIVLVFLPAQYNEWKYVCPAVNMAASATIQRDVFQCPKLVAEPNDNRDAADFEEMAREEIKADAALRRLPAEPLTAYLYHNDSMWRRYPKSTSRIVRHVTNHKVTKHEKCEAGFMYNEMTARYMNPRPMRAVLLEYFHPNVVTEVMNTEEPVDCVVAKNSGLDIFGAPKWIALPGHEEEVIDMETWDGYAEFSINKADRFYEAAPENSEQCISNKPVTVGEHTFIFCVMWKGTSHSEKGQVAVSLRPRNINSECTESIEVVFQTLCPSVDCHDYTVRDSDILKQSLARGEVVAHNFIQWQVLKQKHLGGPENMVRFAVNVKLTKVAEIPTR